MKHLKNTAVLIVFTFLISCSSSLNVASDYDVTANFDAYKTYMYLKWNEDNSKYITKAAQDKLYALLDEEMQARGYSKVDADADMAVNLMALLEEKQSATAYTRYYSTGSIGYYSSFGYGIQSTTYYKKEDILEGSIIVDVFDNESRNLVWQGVAVQEIVENDAKRQRQVAYSVKKMFEKFPKKKL